MRIIAALAAFVILAQPSRAFAFEDPATGFGIAPAAPFSAEPDRRPPFDVWAGVKSATGKPEIRGTGKFICEAGFKAAPENAKLSRDDINALVDKPEWMNHARTALELAFHIDDQQRFALQGYRGFEFQGRPKSGPGAEDARMFLSMVETAKGRTTMICVTAASGFEAAVAQFREIRATINLPK